MADRYDLGLDGDCPYLHSEGDWVEYEDYEKLEARNAELEAKVKGYWASVNQDTVQEYVLAQINADLQARIEELEDRLFNLGAMGEAPCFCCGYNGPGYYQPDQHPCAKRHHEALEEGE